MTDLLNALAKARVRTLILNGAKPADRAPDSGKKWLIMGGTVRHITGTSSIVAVMDKNHVDYLWLLDSVDTAIASKFLPLCMSTDNAANEAKSSNWTPFIVDNNMVLSFFTGDATAYAWIQVLEFDA